PARSPASPPIRREYPRQAAQAGCAHWSTIACTAARGCIFPSTRRSPCQTSHRPYENLAPARFGASSTTLVPARQLQTRLSCSSSCARLVTEQTARAVSEGPPRAGGTPAEAACFADLRATARRRHRLQAAPPRPCRRGG